MRCRTCNIWKIYQDQPELLSKELRLENYEEFFKQNNHWNWISFTGGEPFLRDDLFEIISTAYEYCDTLHTISIPTNGYLTNTVVNQVEKILENTKIPSLYLSISLDGPEYIHDELRGVEGTFERAMNTYNQLKEILDKRLKVNFEYLISKFNQGNLPDFINNVGLSPNDFIISIGQNAFFYENESLEVAPDAELLNADLRWFLSNFKIKSNHDLGQWIFLKHVIKSKQIPCVAGRNSFFMNEFGNIYPCVFIDQVIGSWKTEITKFIKEPGCSCQTPCESYFALLLNLPFSLFNSLM